MGVFVRWLTIHSDKAKLVLVVNNVLSTRYLRIIYGHTASIACAGITKLFVIDCEGKVVMELVSWQHGVRVWCGNSHTVIHPPNTVVSAQFSRHYTTIDGGLLSFLKDIGWRNREICLRVCYRWRKLRSYHNPSNNSYTHWWQFPHLQVVVY